MDELDDHSPTHYARVYAAAVALDTVLPSGTGEQIYRAETSAGCDRCLVHALAAIAGRLAPIHAVRTAAQAALADQEAYCEALAEDQSDD